MIDEDKNTDTDFLRDNDSLYTMPLRIVPFQTPALRRGRLISNLNKLCYQALLSNGFEIPFPQLDLHVKRLPARSGSGPESD